MTASASLTLPDGDEDFYIEADATAGNVNITLPANPFEAQTVAFYKKDASGNEVRFTANVGQTLLQNGTWIATSTQNDATFLRYMNSNWQLI